MTHAGRPATAAMLRLLAVLALVLAGTGALASAASAEDGVGAAAYEAWITTGCGPAKLTLVNHTDAETEFMVTQGESAPVAHVVGPAPEGEVQFIIEDVALRVSIDDLVLDPKPVSAECGGVAKIEPRPCDGEVDVTMQRGGNGPLDYEVLVAGELAATFTVGDEPRTEAVAAQPDDMVMVRDQWNPLDWREMPACERTEPPTKVETPPAIVTAASPIPSQEVAVLGTKFSAPATAAAVPQAPAETAVLGTKVAAAPELARTGPRETAVLTGLGALLVLTGAGLIKAGRRREAPRG